MFAGPIDLVLRIFYIYETLFWLPVRPEWYIYHDHFVETRVKNQGHEVARVRRPPRYSLPSDKLISSRSSELSTEIIKKNVWYGPVSFS